MINPWQIIGWWFIGGIVASPVILAGRWLIDTIKAAREEVVRVETNLDHLTRLYEKRIEHALMLYYNTEGEC